MPGPLNYDPRERPWFQDADRRDGGWLTRPDVFFAAGKQGYTVQLAMQRGRAGVIAGDLLLEVTQELLQREQLTPSAVAFLFDDEDRILAHPRMSELMGREVSGKLLTFRETDMAGVLKDMVAWRNNGISEQFFADPAGRLYAAAFQTIPHSGPSQSTRGHCHCVDEFFANILSERGRLFSRHARIRRSHGSDPIFHRLAAVEITPGAGRRNRQIQRFEPATAPPRAFDHPRNRGARRVVLDDHPVAENLSASFVPRRLVEQLIETGTPFNWRPRLSSLTGFGRHCALRATCHSGWCA